MISSLLTIAMFGFCETEFLCILCVCFKCFSSHLSPVSYHPSPSSSRLIAFWLMLLVCSSVAVRYKKSISIIETVISIDYRYIDFLASYFSDRSRGIDRVGDN